MFPKFSLAALALMAIGSNAQTYSSCNPLTATCPADTGLADKSISTDFTTAKSIPDGWSLTNAGSVTYDGNGANLILAKQGDSPTLQSNFYFLFGSFEVKARASPGQGIVSSMVLLSDDLDEVDWEFTGTNTAQVQSNYFGKGDDSTFDRAAYHGVATPQTTFHTYKIDWSPTAIVWSIDGAPVRTLNFNDAAGGTRFPQTPMRVRLGIWAGGDPTLPPGTVQWAGGPTDYSQAPFTMSIQSVTVVNYSPGASYMYKDNSGTYQSIGISGGTLMSNGAAAVGPSSSGATSSASTSLSTAPPVPTGDPIAHKNNGTANSTTLSKAPGLSATTSAPATATNGAAVVVGGVSAVVLPCAAFVMALFI